MPAHPTFRPARAAAQLAAVAAAALLAASTWAAGVQEDGYFLDASLWRTEVAQSGSGHWPADGWYRLLPGERAIDVRAADTRRAPPEDDAAWYVRIPGAALKAGTRPLYRMTPAVAQPRPGREYQLTLGKSAFAVTVDDVDALTYTIRYAGREHVYRLAAAGSTTAIRAIADLDGDTYPDFIVDAGEQTFLLLSRRAQPGLNPPTAELWAGHEGC